MGRGHKCYSVCAEVRGQFVKLVLSFNLYMGSRIEFRSSLDGKHPYPLSHLASPALDFLARLLHKNSIIIFLAELTVYWFPFSAAELLQPDKRNGLAMATITP